MEDSSPGAFISYSREDAEFALRLAQDLKAAGASVWMDQLDIKPGTPWDDAIERALVAAPQMLAILSPTSANSENVRDEISYALKQGKIVIPVLYMDCVIPLRLERKQHIDFRSDYARGLRALLDHLRIERPVQSVLDKAVEDEAVRKAAWQAREAEGERLAKKREHAGEAAGRAPVGAGLTQWQRVADTFTSPSKTFEDIKRGNRSWWLPLIVVALASYILFGAVVQKVGIRQVTENQIRMNPKTQERMAQATPEQREQTYKISDGITEGFFVAGPLVGMLGALVVAAVLMGTINFGFGGRAKFGDVFAMSYYAWLPTVVKVLLGVAVIYAGVAPDSFNIKNFAPTNLGAFLDPTDTAGWLYALATSLDAVTIWTLVLMSIGVATVAGVKRSAGYIAVFGWWVIIVFFSVVTAVVTG